MAYRNDLAALSARKSALETEVRERQRDLDEASHLIDDIEARRKLPVLDNIRVAAPCPARWADMVGDDRVRACADCQKSVYNLSDMTRDEAQALIVEKEGRLCVRYFQRADGTILLKDCVVGVRQRRRRRIVAVGLTASLAGAAFAYWRSEQTEDYKEEPQLVMGLMEAVPMVDVPSATVDEVPNMPVYEVAGAMRIESVDEAQAPKPTRPTQHPTKFATPPHGKR